MIIPPTGPLESKQSLSKSTSPIRIYYSKILLNVLIVLRSEVQAHHTQYNLDNTRLASVLCVR